MVPDAPATAATAETPYDHSRVDVPNPQVKRRWAERTATAGDFDGDGVNDLIIGDTKKTSPT